MKRTALLRYVPLRRSPLRRKPARDPVNPADRAFVIARDGCVARNLGAPDKCRDTFGNPFIPRERPDLLEVDHIREASMVGKRGASTPRWMCGVCPWHHRLGNPPWATGHRPEIRAYLARVHREAA